MEQMVRPKTEASVLVLLRMSQRCWAFFAGNWCTGQASHIS
jgi:hypothetical protein